MTLQVHLFLCQLCQELTNSHFIRMLTAAALDPLALIGSLPIIGRLIPDPQLANGGEFVTSMCYKSCDSYTKNEHGEGLVQKPALDCLKNSLENLKQMDMTAIDKTLYTIPPGSTEAMPVVNTSLAGLFLFSWLHPNLVWRYLLSFEKYAERILVVRYEEFMADPGQVWNQVILPFCGLKMSQKEGNPPLAPPTLQKDSQQQSGLSRKELKPHLNHLLPRDIQRMDQLIAAAGIASSIADLPGLGDS